MGASDANLLNRLNIELKKSIKEFISFEESECKGADIVKSISESLESNEAVFTLHGLILQLVRAKKHRSSMEKESLRKELSVIKYSLKDLNKYNLNAAQQERISSLIAEFSQDKDENTLISSISSVLKSFALELSQIRGASKDISENNNVENDVETVVSADIKLASNKLIKDVINVTQELTRTYPNEALLKEILSEAVLASNKENKFFTAMNLLERTTRHLSLLIQRERCAAEEILGDIHDNLISICRDSKFVSSLIGSGNEECNKYCEQMSLHLNTMEVQGRNTESIEEMQLHIKKNVSEITDIMGRYATRQNAINKANSIKIKGLTKDVIKASSMVGELESKLSNAEASVLTDELTKVGNRKGYSDFIKRERNVWKSTGQPLSLLIIDIDFFKKINDTYGHSVGDRVLQSLAAILKKTIREVDYIARYGGEEFIIVSPSTELVHAILLAKRIREQINKVRFECKESGKKIKITCSMGVAHFTKEKSGISEVFNFADKALYKAKDLGRDRIVVGKENKLISVKL